MTSLKNRTIEIVCDGEPMDLWEKMLVLHCIRAGTDTNPNCAFAMVAGVSHEAADEAYDEMHRRLKAARITIVRDDRPPAAAPHKDVIIQ